MKDSGIEFIGEIPKYWGVIPIQRVFDEVKNPNKSNSESNAMSFRYGSIVKKKEVGNIDEFQETYQNYNVVMPGTIMINGLNLSFDFVTQRVGLVNEKGIITSTYIAMIPKDLIASSYSYYLLKSYDNCKAFHNMGRGLRSILSYNELKKYKIVLPPLMEQHRIVDYLEKKCAEIDIVIENTKASIKEYKEYKQSIITEAVTKGLYRNVNMKSSNVEWIGEFPEHWETTKLKYIFSIKKDIANELGHEILSVTQSGLKIKDISNNEGQISSDYSKYQLVDIDDFVMNHMDLLTGWVDCSKYMGVTSPDYRVFKLNKAEHHCKEFYTYLFQICYKNRIFYGLGQGVSNLGRWRLQTDKFINFMLPMVPLKEQQAIAYYLDQKCIEIDNLISQKQQIISELEAYKKSLIFECVTGKKEV